MATVISENPAKSDSPASKMDPGKKHKPLSEHKTKTLLNQLEQLWIPYATKGLEVRIKMGRKLNDTLGSPLDRQAHGQAVLKKASERLSIAESELSRMRWFAHLFQTPEQLREQHPQLTNWTKVREELPRFIAAAKHRDIPAAPSPKISAVYGGLRKSLDSLIEKFERQEVEFDDEQREEMLLRIEKFAAAAALRLQVTFLVERPDLAVA